MKIITNMKTIKLIGITFLFLFPNLTILAQHNEGPTQEETIAWITDKLERYSPYHYEKLEVTPCAITEYIKRADGTGSDVFRNPTTINLAYKIKEGIIWFSYDSDVVQAEKPDGIKMISDGIFINDSEPDLAKRMQKAIKHLATFCEAKKKEEVF